MPKLDLCPLSELIHNNYYCNGTQESVLIRMSSFQWSKDALHGVLVRESPLIIMTLNTMDDELSVCRLHGPLSFQASSRQLLPIKSCLFL